MGKRGPILFGMLLSLSFFSGLLTLLLLSGTTTPIPPASQLPSILPPEAEGSDVVTNPGGRLQIPFPTLGGGGSGVTTATDPTLTVTIPGAGVAPSAPGGGGPESPVIEQPPGVVPREEPEEEEDRHEHRRGKGHQKKHGKGHFDATDDGGSQGRTGSGDPDRGPKGAQGSGGKAKGKGAKKR